MKLKEFIDKNEIQLPITRDTDDFQGFAEGVLSNYINLLNQLELPGSLQSVIEANRPKVAAFCSAAQCVIREILAGQPADAYNQFTEGIKNIEQHLQQQALRDLGTADLQLMYRVRRDPTPNLNREDLFHIPFEDRHKVATQRYSIPGLPCLYLAGSLYTCWAEMGRPPFHELQAAAFWLAPHRRVSIINFSSRPKLVSRLINSESGFEDNNEIRSEIINYIFLWPLMALCSIIVKHKNSPFKPEYIMPQMLLQWITKEKLFDGICYFSMHVPAICPAYPLANCNLIFPATKIRHAGRCERLRDLFRMTMPHGWQLLSAVRAGHDTHNHKIPAYPFEFIPGRKEFYSQTDFGVVESRLNKLAKDDIDSDQSGNGSAMVAQ